MRYYHSAGIILYRIKEGQIQYLLLHYLSGHWDFPKGKIESGESRADAALRELQEETGLQAALDISVEFSTNYEFTDYDGQRAHKTVDFFLGELIGSGKVTLSDEHIGFNWLSYEAAHKLITYEKNILAEAHVALLHKIDAKTS